MVVVCCSSAAEKLLVQSTQGCTWPHRSRRSAFWMGDSSCASCKASELGKNESNRSGLVEWLYHVVSWKMSLNVFDL